MVDRARRGAVRAQPCLCSAFSSRLPRVLLRSPRSLRRSHLHRMANPTPTKGPHKTLEEVEALRMEDTKLMGAIVDHGEEHAPPAAAVELEPEPEPEPEACQPSPAKSYQASPAAKGMSTPTREALQGTTEPWPLSTFVIDGPIIVLSPKLKWRECTVSEIEPNGTVYHGSQVVAEGVPCIKVTYVGFAAAFDEWLDLMQDSNRIRPAASRAAAKLRAGLGELSPNQRLQEHKKAEVCLPWLSNSPVQPTAVATLK